MWRYISGASPPPPKVRKTAEEKIESQRKYDKDVRSRKFQDSWKNEFKWLKYDETKNHMLCIICKKYSTEEEGGSYVTGCVNFKKPSIQAHEKSESHQLNVKKENSKTQPRGTCDGDKAVMMLNSAAITKLTYLFRNAHYLAKAGRPYTDFKTLCILDKRKDIDLGNTYITDKYCQKFIRAIADSQREKQDEVVTSSPFISIISDGSTDTSSKEAEIVLVRSSLRGKVHTQFMGIKNVPKADGENIAKAITSCLTDKFGDDWKTKVVAMGTDGASVMLGQKSGVVQRIREYTDRPFIYAIHCSAHRLELAYRDGLKALQTTTPQKCDALLLNLYLFYKYSPLNRANLQAAFASLGMKMKVPTRVGGTRWLAHTKRAIDHVLFGLPAISLHLEQIQNPGDAAHRKDSAAKGKNFLKLLKDRNVTFWLYSQMDIVSALAQVSEAIQQKNISLGDVWNELESVKCILTKYKTSPGTYLRKWYKQDDTQQPALECSRQQFLQAIISGLNSRFDSDLHLFKGSYFTSFKNWPSSLNEELEDFADMEVVDIAQSCEPALKAYNCDLEVESIELEWIRLKREIYNSRKVEAIAKLTWQDLWDSMQPKYTNLFALIELLLTLPSSSVDAERGFSRMKITKNDWRSSLSSSSLSDLMLIHSETESVEEFDPMDSILLWNSSGSRARRPFYNEKVKSVKVTNRSLSIDTDDVFLIAEELDVARESVCDDDGDNDDNASDDEDYMHRQDLIALQNRAYRLMMDLVE